jgi:hypothetical protein
MLVFCHLCLSAILSEFKTAFNILAYFMNILTWVKGLCPEKLKFQETGMGLELGKVFERNSSCCISLTVIEEECGEEKNVCL